jgi:DNA-binding transcriptional regulator YiaG
MEFGLIKSKIEKKLSDSYMNESFKKEFATFKKLVLENESLSKAFHIYNELGEKKGYDDRFAEDFLEECVDLYNRLEVDEKSIYLLNKWIKNVVTENNYKKIDSVLNADSVLIEERIKSKNQILENLKSKKEDKNLINIPMEKMIEIANKNLNNHLSQLSESEVEQIKKYTSLSKDELSKRYEVISEMVFEKLETLSKSSDNETKQRINETVKRIKTQDINTLSFIKLKSLNETL